MTHRPTFELIPIASLHDHEEVDESKVRVLAQALLAEGVFRDPIWVARGSGVILNGHHRTEALRRLGATRVPAWVVDYASDVVRLGRWRPGPPIAKEEVIARAREARRFPPQTTRHSIEVQLPPRPTPLAELGVPGAGRGAASHPRRAAGRARPGSAPRG